MAADAQAPSGSAPQGNAAQPSRLGIRSISEVSQVRDAELSVIFTEMRRASGVTREQIAGRLATGVGTIEALEEGALSRLPEWNEVKRVVTAYSAQLGLDARPILRRMQARLGIADEANVAATAIPEPVTPGPRPSPPHPGPYAARPAAAPGGPPMPPSARAKRSGPPTPPGAKAPPRRSPAPPRPQPDPAKQSGARAAQSTTIQPHTTLEPDAPLVEKRRGRAARIVTGLINWVLLIGLVAALGLGIWYAVKNPRTVWSALDAMPEPIPQMMRAAWEIVRPLENAPAGSGVSDPDNRRSDKLP